MLLRVLVAFSSFVSRCDAMMIASSSTAPRSVAPINHCVSVGPSCRAAEFLKHHPAGLRRYALPFDWIHSDTSLVRDCLDDGFRLLLDRCSMESVAWTSQKRRARHTHLRTAAHAHIFEHHDPAEVDDDYKYLHRACDRLRRLLADGESRTLFLHLEVDADPRGGDAFVEDARGLYSCLAERTANFALVAVRCVHRGSETPPPGLPVVLEQRVSGLEDGDELHVLELQSRSQSVVPFTTWREQPTADELADLAALVSALDDRFRFEPRPEPPPCTPTSLMARTAWPRWVWAEGAHVPCVLATPSELLRAAALLPDGCNAAVPLLGRSRGVPSEERIGPEARQSALAGGEVDVWAWAYEWVAQAEQAGCAMADCDWHAAAARLAAPASLRSERTLGVLVATLLSSQLAQLRAQHGATASVMSQVWDQERSG
tara:strand:- start:3589 stop:4878 length:1290 start_codon:yes stop_codon:yes gene_type:complete